MMAITLLCPKLTCRAVLRVPESVRGKQVRCPECSATFMVPAQDKAAPKKPRPTEKSKLDK